MNKLKKSGLIILSAIGLLLVVCFGSYFLKEQNIKKIYKNEYFSYSLKGLPVTVSKETQPFDWTSDKLKALADECGTKYEKGYFDKLVAKFKDTNKVVYNFKYQGASQTNLIFKVTILPNKLGYTSLDKFNKDFQQCFVAGDAYPLLINKDWLLFVNSCGSGIDDESGRPDGCGEVDTAVVSTLKLN